MMNESVIMTNDRNFRLNDHHSFDNEEAALQPEQVSVTIRTVNRNMSPITKPNKEKGITSSNSGNFHFVRMNFHHFHGLLK